MGPTGIPAKPPNHVPLAHRGQRGSVPPGPPPRTRLGPVPLCPRKWGIYPTVPVHLVTLGCASSLSLKLPQSGGDPEQRRQESIGTGGPFAGDAGGPAAGPVSFICSPFLMLIQLPFNEGVGLDKGRGKQGQTGKLCREHLLISFHLSPRASWQL